MSFSANSMQQKITILMHNFSWDKYCVTYLAFKLSLFSDAFCWMCPKIVGGWSSAPGPAGGALTLPQTPQLQRSGLCPSILVHFAPSNLVRYARSKHQQLAMELKCPPQKKMKSWIRPCIQHTGPQLYFLGYIICMGQVYCMNLWSNHVDDL
jgi:hypothetical protein